MKKEMKKAKCSKYFSDGKHNWEKTGKIWDWSNGEMINVGNYSIDKKCTLCGKVASFGLTNAEIKEENDKRFCSICQTSKELHLVDETVSQALICQLAKMSKQIEKINSEVTILDDKINNLDDKIIKTKSESDLY